jgi:hypothetical protein
MAARKTPPSNTLAKDVRKVILSNLNSTTYFIILYTIAIVMDGLYGIHFDTNAILYGYGVIVSKNLIAHGINSTLNSDRGKMPEPVNKVTSVIDTVTSVANVAKAIKK